jgi:hypothetical protein
VTQAPIEQAVPLVRRALKVLTDREVTPQLGLLKSTLLQLDSTFSERTYGAGSFRDFAQKLAAAGHVVLRESGRTVIVELSDTPASREEDAPRRTQAAAQPAAEAPVQSSNGARAADGVREVRRLFQSAQNPPRWPMYIRQAKQFLRNVDASFDERRYGFGNLGDLMRACQREGLFRIERDRQGVMRLFPGNVMQQPVEARDEGVAATDEQISDLPETESPGGFGEPAEAVAAQWPPESSGVVEPELVDGDVLQEMETPVSVIDVQPEQSPLEEGQPAEQPAGQRRSRGRGRGRSGGEGRSTRKASEGAQAPRARKTSAKPRASRARARTKEVPPTD